MKDETKQILEIVTDMQEQMATKDDLANLERELHGKLSSLESRLRDEIRDTKDHLETIISKDADLFSERTMNHERRLTAIESNLGIQPAIPVV